MDLNHKKFHLQQERNLVICILGSERHGLSRGIPVEKICCTGDGYSTIQKFCLLLNYRRDKAGIANQHRNIQQIRFVKLLGFPALYKLKRCVAARFANPSS